MSDDLRVQAALAGVSQTRFALFQRMGISVERFSLFEKFDDDNLQELASYQMFAAEMIAAVENDNWGVHNVLTYARLRQVGIETTEIVADASNPGELLRGIEADLEVGYVRRAVKDKLPIHTLIIAIGAGITYDEAFKVNDTRAGSLGPYTNARAKGYPHKELLAFIGKTDSRSVRLGLDTYGDLRQVGITHAQIMSVMRNRQITEEGRGYYAQYVLDEKRPLTHDQAVELAVLGVYPRHYWSGRGPRTHEDVMKAINQGVVGDGLVKYGVFLDSNCRITQEEVLQYLQIDDHRYLPSINAYIKLLDAGFTFEEIDEAHKVGVSLWDFAELRGGKPLSLTQQELLQVAESGIALDLYTQLRGEGIAHATILKNVQTQNVA